MTGASSGIGEEFARQVAERGGHLVLVARSLGKIETLAHELGRVHGVQVKVLGLDLAEPNSGRRVVTFLHEQGVEIAALINNAGVGRAHALARDDAEISLRLLDLNVRALTELTALLLPGLIARGNGGVLLVSSLVAFFPVPEMAVYAASKAYVRSFGEGLRAELSGSGVHVTVLCPGNVPSGFQAAAGFAAGSVSTLGELSPRATARAGLAGFLRRKGRVIPGFINRLAVCATAFLPNSWIARVAAFVLQRSGRFD